MVVEAEMKKHTMDVQEVHTMEGVCNPSWTYTHQGFFPLNTDCVALPLGIPFGQYSNSLRHALLQQK